MPWLGLKAHDRRQLDHRSNAVQEALHDLHAALKAVFGNLPVQHRRRQTDGSGLAHASPQELLERVEFAGRSSSRAVLPVVLAAQNGADGIAGEPRFPRDRPDLLALAVQDVYFHLTPL